MLAGSLAVQFIDTRQWSLPSGQRVVAGFDRSSGQESVWCDTTLVSRARLGTKAEGHTLPLDVASGDPYRAGARVAAVFFQRDGIPFLELAGQRMPPDGADPACTSASVDASAPRQLVASSPPTHRPCGRVEPAAPALDGPRRSAAPRPVRRGPQPPSP